MQRSLLSIFLFLISTVAAAAPTNVYVQCDEAGPIYYGTLAWDLSIADWSFTKSYCQMASPDCGSAYQPSCQIICDWTPKIAQQGTLIFNGIQYQITPSGTQSSTPGATSGNPNYACQAQYLSITDPPQGHPPPAINAWTQLTSYQVYNDGEGDVAYTPTALTLCGTGATPAGYMTQVTMTIKNNAMATMTVSDGKSACYVAPAD